MQHDDLHFASPPSVALVVGAFTLAHQLTCQQQVLRVERGIALQQQHVTWLSRSPEGSDRVAQPRLRLEVHKVEHLTVLRGEAAPFEDRLNVALPRSER